MASDDLRRKILVVDDEPTNLKLLREILRGEYDLAFARNGLEMLRLAREGPDLILLDVMMPDMDGYEGCVRLKADEATRDIPVIFVTARVEMEDEVRGFAVGAVDYLVKPVRGPVVRARVATHLALREAMVVIAAQSREIAKQNEALQEAARLRDDVDQIVRHDLKGPLNAVIGLPGTLVRELSLNEEQLLCLRVIEESGFRMLNMINLSHDLYKMERGSYQVDFKAVDLVLVLQRVVSELQGLIAAKRLQLVVLVDGRPPEGALVVAGEALLYHSMVSNLVRNAVEASPERESLTIALSRGAMVSMCITNQGSVPESIRDRFFDKFVTAGKGHGTGLGTYSARLMVTTVGGEITLDTSRPGATSVTVRLPVMA